jgi:hypothetical protein
VSVRRTDIKPKVTKGRKKAPAAEPKAPRAATTKPATARSKMISRVVAPSLPLPSYEEDGQRHQLPRRIA